MCFGSFVFFFRTLAVNSDSDFVVVVCFDNRVVQETAGLQWLIGTNDDSGQLMVTMPITTATDDRDVCVCVCARARVRVCPRTCVDSGVKRNRMERGREVPTEGGGEGQTEGREHGDRQREGRDEMRCEEGKHCGGPKGQTITVTKMLSPATIS